MKKRTWALALALLMMLGAVSAAAESDGSSGYTQTMDELGISFTIADTWIASAMDGSVGLWQRNADDNTPAGVVGYVTLYIPYEDDVSPSEEDSADNQALENWINGTHCALIGIVSYREAEADTAQIDALYPGLTRISLGTDGEYAFALYRNDAVAASALTDENKAIAASVVDSFTSPESVVSVFAPIEKKTELGEFTTTSLDGQTVTAEIFTQAKLTVVNIWATYCSPCLEEMPDLGELAKEYADKGVQFVGIVSDASDDDTIETAKDVVEQTGAAYTHLLPGSFLDWVQYVPTTLFVDASGNQIGEAAVGGMTKEQWIEKIDAALASVE